MELNLEVLSGLERKLSIAFSAEEVKTSYQQAFKKHQKEVKLPGFRPGKVPLSLMEKRFGPQLQAEAKESLVNKALQQAAEKYALKLAYEATLDAHFEQIDLRTAKDLSCSANFEVAPAIEIINNLQGKIAKETPRVETAEIETQKRELELHFAEYSPCEDGLTNDDKVELLITGDIEGGEKFNAPNEKTSVQIGRKQLEEALEQAIVGGKPGEKRALSHEFSSNFSDPKLAGKKVDFTLEILSVQRPNPFHWDESQFAKVSPKVHSLEDLKTWIQDRILEQKSQQIEARKIEELKAFLQKELSFDVPQKFINDNLAEFELKDPSYSRLRAALDKANLEKSDQVLVHNHGPDHDHGADSAKGDSHAHDQYSKQEALAKLEELKADFKKRLFEDLRLELYLQKIAVDQKLKPQEVAVIQDFTRYAGYLGMDPRELIKNSYGKRIFQQMNDDNLKRQALQWNYSHAVL